ncbi:MAG: hypothetical protein DMG70_16145 [Acidobacteria bacterium]|nr:MAG: hypothetical protein DMG70_16145 [Acidobacteriota bacterium]
MTGAALILLMNFDSVSAQMPGFSPNQELALPYLAPVGGPSGPEAFVVRGLEPSVRTDSQGTVYVSSIRGVPGGTDLHRWYQAVDGPPNADGTLPFKYEGQPDNCGILTNGCAGNVGNTTNPGVTPGGGDVDIAVNAPAPGTNVPNLGLVSLSLAPGVTATHSTNRGDSFTVPNLVAALIPGDDRQWIDGTGSNLIYQNYHDVATFNIEVQRSNDGGQTYVNGFGEAIDPKTFAAAGNVTPTATANIAGRIQVDRSSCGTRGSLYQIFVAPDNVTENTGGMPMRSVYVGVSNDVKKGQRVFTFTDHKVFTSPAGSPGAANGTDNIFPALAVDGLGYLYAVWSDNSNIFLSSSGDQGKTWTAPVQVNQGPTVGKANVFPWVAADSNGHVVVVWLGDNTVGNSNDRATLEPGHPASQGAACSSGNTCMQEWAQWNVYMAESVNGHSSTPTFTQSETSDHVIHRGTVSTGGLGGGADRALADLFQVSLDPEHRANMAFSDDHKPHPLCSWLGSGQCGADDPRTTRLTRANFTRQLEANASIVKGGSCAAPSQFEQGEQEAGEGETQNSDGSKNDFSFLSYGSPRNGVLQYDDNSAHLHLRSSNGIASLSFSGSCGTSAGNAKVNGQSGYAFTAVACDYGSTSLDTFAISVSGPKGFTYGKTGNLSSGFVHLTP